MGEKSFQRTPTEVCSKINMSGSMATNSSNNGRPMVYGQIKNSLVSDTSLSVICLVPHSLIWFYSSALITQIRIVIYRLIDGTSALLAGAGIWPKVPDVEDSFGSLYGQQIKWRVFFYRLFYSFFSIYIVTLIPQLQILYFCPCDSFYYLSLQFTP